MRSNQRHTSSCDSSTFSALKLDELKLDVTKSVTNVNFTNAMSHQEFMPANFWETSRGLNNVPATVKKHATARSACTLTESIHIMNYGSCYL